MLIVGGGISGLAAAYDLHRAGAECTVFEKSPRLGGVIETRCWQDCLLDCGPDSFLSAKPEALALIRELGLESEVIGSNDHQRTTYILKHDRLIPLPDGVMMIVPTKVMPMVLTPLLSWRTKLGMARELLRRPRTYPDRSVAEFVVDHFGRETLEYLAEPLLSGIYGGDPRELSVNSVLPRFVEMEAREGSLSRAVIKSTQRSRSTAARDNQQSPDGRGLKNTASLTVGPQVHRLKPVPPKPDDPRPDGRGLKNTPSLTVGPQVHRLKPAPPKPDDPRADGRGLTGASLFRTLKGGLGTLVNALAKDVRVEHQNVEAMGRKGGNRFWVRAGGHEVEADHVILAGPAWSAAELVRGIDGELSRLLNGIPYSSSAIVSLIYDAAGFDGMRAGFGFLVPKRERQRLAACTFVNTKFPFRAPENRIVLRCFFGGVGDGGALEESDESLVAIAREELRRILGLSAAPVHHTVAKWPRSMAQYVVGHGERVRKIQDRVAAIPGLHLAGNGYEGIGIPDCVRTGRRAAKGIIEG